LTAFLGDLLIIYNLAVSYKCQLCQYGGIRHE
jgi:hypothetical protein